MTNDQWSIINNQLPSTNNQIISNNQNFDYSNEKIFFWLFEHWLLEFIVNGLIKESLRGAKRRGNLMRLLHFVRNDATRTSTYLWRSL